MARQIAFVNVGDNPTATPRVVRFTVNDGDGGTSLAATRETAYSDAFKAIAGGDIVAFSLNPTMSYTASDNSLKKIDFIPDTDNQCVIVDGAPGSLLLSDNTALTYNAAYGSGLTDMADGDTVYGIIDPAGTQN